MPVIARNAIHDTCIKKKSQWKIDMPLFKNCSIYLGQCI